MPTEPLLQNSNAVTVFEKRLRPRPETCAAAVELDEPPWRLRVAPMPNQAGMICHRRRSASDTIAATAARVEREDGVEPRAGGASCG
jgi:hypothetical protein